MAALVVTQLSGMLPSSTRYAAAATVYTVTTGSDHDDGVCDADCTMREAINAANGTQLAEIHFDLPAPYTITPTSALPATISPVYIDGSTLPGNTGSLFVVLDGNSAGAASSGLVVAGGDTTIRGFSIVRFGHWGIELQSSNNFVGNNYIGLSTSGTALGNGRSTQQPLGIIYGGVLVASGSNNTVGNSDQLNVVAGNAGQGIEVSSAAQNTRVANNLVGISFRAGPSFGNTVNGIYVGASGTTVANNISVLNGSGLSFSADSLTVRSNTFS